MFYYALPTTLGDYGNKNSRRDLGGNTDKLYEAGTGFHSALHSPSSSQHLVYGSYLPLSVVCLPNETCAQRVCLRARIGMCAYVWIRVHICMCKHVCVHVYVCVCTWVHVCVYVCVFMYVCVAVCVLYMCVCQCYELEKGN